MWTWCFAAAPIAVGCAPIGSIFRAPGPGCAPSPLAPRVGLTSSLPKPQTQSWSLFTQARDTRRSHALAAAAPLLDGHPLPARSLLGAWRFSSDPAACDRLLEQLVTTPPCPPAAHMAATLHDAPSEGPEPAGATDQRQHLFDHFQDTPDAPAELPTRVAWGLEALAWHGARIEAEERQAWRAPPVLHPKRDGRMAAVWKAVLSGDFWSVQNDVEKLLLPAARRAFAAGLRARGVPEASRRPYIAEYTEAFFWTFLGGREGTPGWKDAAVRILEQAGAGPVDALSTHFDAEAWSWLVACPTFSSPSWRATRTWALPDYPNALARAGALQRMGPGNPGLLEHLLDGQVALRLVASWADSGEVRTGPDRSWNVVMRHRGRTRGRLRALLLETTSDSLLQLLDLPGLHARSASAVAAQGWARACEVVHQHQLPAWDSSPTPSCEQPPFLEADFPPSVHRTIGCWMLLTLLRDRWAAMEHWVHTGTWLKRPDSGWGRLLHDALPARLRDADGGYDRIQSHLRLHWDEQLAVLRPVIAAIAACSKGTEVRAALDPYWEPEVPLPSRMGKGAIQAAAQLLQALDTA